MIENTNTKQFYPGPILNDTLEINEFLFNTAEQIKIKHSKLDENGVLRDVDLEYGYDYEVVKDEALTCEDDEMPSHAHIAEMALTASTGQIILKEHVTVLAGERLTAYRESAIIQDKNYPRTGAFPAAAHEGALDYLTMQNQEQQDELDRALKVPISTQNFAGSMPLPIPGRALKINQDGSGFEMSEFDPDIALTTTENFRNEAQQFASEAALSASSAKSSEMSTSQKVNEITVLHNNYTENITNLSEDYKQQIDTKSTNYLNQINSRGNTIIKDADAIINRVGFNMFDTVVKDHALTYPDGQGLALQGTYVYRDALVGTRYGYPDFYNKCIEECMEAQALGTKAITLGNTTLNLWVHPNGHIYYDVPSGMNAIDGWYNTYGHAWFYGIDTANKRIRLPRNVWFEQMTNNPAQVGLGTEAGLPNITGSFYTATFTRDVVNDITQSGALYCGNKVSKAAHGSQAGANTRQGLDFDASRSNAIYGKSTTVQPRSVRKLLYICVGNTVSDTSWVDAVTQVQGGVKDLEDKKNTSIAEIDANAKSYDNLTKRQITNCLLEIPQRIKLELTDGVLKLKAGSVVTVPNGFEANGTTPKFDYVTIESDRDMPNGSTTAGQRMCWVAVPNGHGNGVAQYCFSGNTSVMNSTKADTFSTFYNTETNKIYRGNGTTWEERHYSFPVCLATNDTTTKFTSIDQVFNGMGYFGNTFWVDKGVKILSSNGWNNDGSYKNIEGHITKIKLLTTTNKGAKTLGLYFNQDGSYNGFSLGVYKYTIKSLKNRPTTWTSGSWIYVEDENRVYVNQNVAPANVVMFADITITDAGITKLDASNTFRAVDYNDLQNGTNFKTVIETYVNGASWYRVWSDGWIEQGGNFGASNSGWTETTLTFLKKFSNTNFSLFCQGNWNEATATSCKITARSVSGATVVHANNLWSAQPSKWYACGY